MADLIGVDFAPDLFSTESFRRLQGGSPANLAANMARLGHHTALVACVGNDKLGQYLTAEIAKTGVDTSFVVQDTSHPTSLVLVSRTRSTPDFIAYREADSQLLAAHFPDSLLAETAIFHTTCFALSREPARSAIMDAAHRAHQLGAKVSLDANYAPSLWPDRHEARRCVAKYVEGGLVKLSDDDAHRLFGRTVDLEDVLAYFHEQSVELVCYTLGAAGSVVSWDNGARRKHFPVEAVEVKDATGAGDAYWSGFLSAFSQGHAPEVCAQAGARMAARKISTIGPLPTRLATDFLYGK